MPIRVVERAAGDAHVEGCLTIAQALPDYFTADAVAAIHRALAEGPASVVEEAADGVRAVAGFAIVEHKGPAVAELAWMVVHPARRGQGYGSALLAAVAERLRARGVQLLEVKTLAPEADYAPYEATRRFYERAGFLHLETVDPYPGWEPGSPCAIYVKILTGDP
jgi:GNAT superfamily N-acetyltransferase